MHEVFHLLAEDSLCADLRTKHLVETKSFLGSRVHEGLFGHLRPYLRVLIVFSFFFHYRLYPNGDVYFGFHLYLQVLQQSS